MGEWIDGIAVAKDIQAEAETEVRKLAEKGCRPGLAVILVGENPASQVYVRSKVKTCQALGMYSEKIEMAVSSSTEEVLAAVNGLNRRDDIHGILVQMPLPPQVDAKAVINAVRPDKDVDGFHPINVGKLVEGTAVLKPCTPAGIMEMLKRRKVAIAGSRAVVIGRSDIVGKPISMMLMHAHATVTICHSKTRDLPGVAREGDILVAAMGRPVFVDDTFVKPGATVIDVGVNRMDSLDQIHAVFGEDPARLADYGKKGYTLVGDVHPGKVFPKCALLTPVPGGVGPLTIAMLMTNTVKAAAALLGLPVPVFG